MEEYESRMTSLVERATLVSAIKRLNQRKRELEHRGLTQTEAYKNLDRWAKAMPHNAIEYPNGEVRYYAKQSPKNVSENMFRRTMAIDKNKATTVTHIMNQARRISKAMGKPPTKETLTHIANQSGKLHDFIEHHTDAYYGIPQMAEAVRRKSPNAQLTDEEASWFYELMDRYETDRAEVEKQAKDWRNTQGWE